MFIFAGIHVAPENIGRRPDLLFESDICSIVTIRHPHYVPSVIYRTKFEPTLLPSDSPFI